MDYVFQYMYRILIALIGVMIAGIFFTFSIKNKWIQWLLILLPPFVLLFLIRIPIDIISFTFVWLPGMAACVFSVVSIIVRFVKVIVKLRKKTFYKSYLVRFIRPALTIIFFSLAFHLVKLSEEYADERGIEIAKQLHQRCNQENSIPLRIEGWEDYHSGSSVTYEGRFGSKYPVRYWASSEDPNTFKIEVRHNIDESLYIYGGINQKLQKQYDRGDGDRGEKIDIEID